MSIAPTTNGIDFDLNIYGDTFEITAYTYGRGDALVTSGPVADAERVWAQVMMAAFGF